MSVVYMIKVDGGERDFKNRKEVENEHLERDGRIYC